MFAKQGVLHDLSPSSEEKYIIRLENGDILTGYIEQLHNDPERGPGIRFDTKIGVTVIYDEEILEISKYYESYRHAHRIFVMPTAQPIKDNHFIGNFELGFFYLGFGISDYLSITMGRSIIPGIPSYHQISIFNVKGSVFQMDWAETPGGMNLAVGTNLAYINHNNQILNFYGAATFHNDRTRVTATIFNKQGPRSAYEIRFHDNLYPMNYENGAFGIGLGIDTKFPKWHSIHFIGEFVTPNIIKPTNAGVTMGIRHASTEFSADFGIAFFTQPFLVPFVSFVWTPF